MQELQKIRRFFIYLHGSKNNDITRLEVQHSDKRVAFGDGIYLIDRGIQYLVLDEEKVNITNVVNGSAWADYQ